MGAVTVPACLMVAAPPPGRTAPSLSWSANADDDHFCGEFTTMIRTGTARLAVCCLVAAGVLIPLSSLRAAPAVPADGPQAKLAKECGACHMVFQPELLPARSWTALMGGLANHFGENAALDADTTRDILGYLQAHAADARGGGHHNHNLRGLSSS